MADSEPVLTAETERPKLAVTRAGTGPNYVLLHGGMGSWNHWARNIDALAEHFSVHAVDLPGYGASPDVDRDMSGEDYRALVCRAIETMLGDGAEFRLTGFSFGSVLSSHVAAQFGDRVAGLSLIGASGFGPPEGRDLNTRSYKSAQGDPDLLRQIVRENLLAFMLTDPGSVDDTAIRYHGDNVRRTRFDTSRVRRHIDCRRFTARKQKDATNSESKRGCADSRKTTPFRREFASFVFMWARRKSLIKPSSFRSGDRSGLLPVWSIWRRGSIRSISKFSAISDQTKPGKTSYCRLRRGSRTHRRSSRAATPSCTMC